MTTRHYLIVALVTCVALVSCSNSAAPIPGTGRVTPQMRVVGGDLNLRMTPGGGQSDLARRVASSIGAEGSEPTTARHLASVDWEGGRADVVVFRSDDNLCISVLGGAACGPDLLQAVGLIMLSEGDGHGVLLGVPDGGVEAVFTTGEGHTVSVLPLDGLAWAGWPSRLGGPTEVSVFDANGEEVWHEAVDPG